MSTLYVDTINEKTSGNGIQIPGHVVQVVQTNYTGTSSFSGTSFTEITGLAVTITPKFASSKILWSCSISQGETSDTFPAYRLLRDSTALNVASAISPGTGCTFAGVRTQANSRDQYLISQLGYQYLDSPNTTSAITYKVQVRPMGTTSKTVYINRSETIGDSNQLTATSTVTVMEIAQ